MPVLGFLLPLALASVPPVSSGAEAKDGITLASDSEARWIAFDLTPSNQIRFEAVLNGRPVRAVLDTGLTNTLATQDFATRARLAPGHPHPAPAIGGGVGGASAPRRTPLTGGAPPPRGGALQPVAGVPLTETRLAGARLRPMIVDTGDGASVTLSRAAWAGADYRGAAISTTLGWGIGGPLVSEVAVVNGFTLGGAALPETELRIEGEGGYSAAAGVAGRIGTGLLLRYRVLLDPRAGRMVLQPGAMAAAPVLRSTSGLLLGAEGTHLRVLHVMRGSPAAESGWHEGETICAADGVPVAGRPIEWSAGAPGRTVALTLCDGSERMLTLRQFY